MKKHQSYVANKANRTIKFYIQHELIVWGIKVCVNRHIAEIAWKEFSGIISECWDYGGFIFLCVNYHCFVFSKMNIYNFLISRKRKDFLFKKINPILKRKRNVKYLGINLRNVKNLHKQTLKGQVHKKEGFCKTFMGKSHVCGKSHIFKEFIKTRSFGYSHWNSFYLFFNKNT